MQNIDNKTKAHIQKLLALAKHGVGGEASNAQRFLEKILAKNGLTMDDIEESEQKPHWVSLSFRSALEERLALQVISKVLDTAKFKIRRKPRSKNLWFELTASQHAEVVMHIAAMKPALKKHMDLAFSAFIQVNELFPERPSGNEESHLSRDEINAIVSMMQGTERVAVRKGITNAA